MSSLPKLGTTDRLTSQELHTNAEERLILAWSTFRLMREGLGGKG